MGIKYGRGWGGREFRFRGDLYSQGSTFPLVVNKSTRNNVCYVVPVTRELSYCYKVFLSHAQVEDLGLPSVNHVDRTFEFGYDSARL